MASSHFLQPCLICLCLAGGIRNGAGISWAYNIKPYFAQYYPQTHVMRYMLWIPLVFGSLGVFGGGLLSDRLTRNRGIHGRLLVLICCCMLASPFQAGALLLAPPWAFLSHILGVLVGEAWLGVCAAVVVELLPSDLRASGTAVYFFFIQMIGGNMNLCVPPLTALFNLRVALLLCFPALYVIASGLFLLSFKLLKYSSNSKAQSQSVAVRHENGTGQLSAAEMEMNGDDTLRKEAEHCADSALLQTV